MFNPYYQAPNYAAQGLQPNMQQMQSQYGAGRLLVKGRPVGSVEEVRAAQVDFDGSISYFPCMADGSIYTKGIDLNGIPIIQRYVLERPGQEGKVVTVSMLENRLAQLMEVRHEQSNAAVSNVANEQQSNGYDATAVR